MSSRNIWNNNTNKNITQTIINRKNLKFILEGETTTDNQMILKFLSSSPIILNLHGYQTNDDISDSTYFKTILYSDSFDYTTIYKNQIIDINKDINKTSRFHIKTSKTNFYYYVEMFSKSDISITSNFKLTNQ